MDTTGTERTDRERVEFEERIARGVEAKVVAGSRTIGYVVAAAVNVVVLWIANQLLEWEWPSFLTPAFDELLPIITVSCVAGVVVNLVLAWRDPPPLKSFGNLVTSTIGFVGAVWTFRVFPFDFSTWSTDWSWLLRAAVIVGMIGTAIGATVELFRLASGTPRRC